MTQGRHSRTSPGVKDVFLKMYKQGGTIFDDARGAAVHWWFLNTPEISATRRINFNSDGITGHVDQQALLFFNGGLDPLATEEERAFGRVRCLASPFTCYPNIVGIKTEGDYQNWQLDNNVLIYESTIRQHTPDSHSEITEDIVDEHVFRSVVGHEFGHALGIGHNADLSSIMRQKTVYDGVWSSIMHAFLPGDLAQVRLK